MIGARPGLVLLTAATAAAALAGCGSSGSANAGSGPSSGGSSASSLAPYKLVSIQDTAGDNAQLIKDGAGAAIDEINASGGINGHQIQLTFCSTNNDPNQAAQCARTAVADHSVVAVTSDSTSYATNIDPVLEKAGVPVIGGVPFSAGDFASKVVFSANPGALGTPAEGVIIVQQLKGKKIGVPYVDVPAGAGIKPLMEAIAGPLGGQVVANVPVPLAAVDVTTEAAAVVAAKPDGVVDALLTPTMIALIKSVRQQGSTVPFVVGVNDLGTKTIQSQLSGANSNLYAAAWFNYQSAGYKEYQTDMAKYAPKALDATNDLSAAAWLNIKMFALAAGKTLKATNNAALTPAALLATMNAYTDFNVGGMTPVIDFAKAQTALGGSFSRIQDPYYYPVKYENGAWVSLNNETPVNVFSPS